MKNDKPKGWLAKIYKKMEAPRKKLENKWTLEYDQDNKDFIIDSADSCFDSTTDDCIFDERENSIILGVFDTMTECVEYYNNIVIIKRERDHDEHGHVNPETDRKYPLRMADCSNNLIDKILEKENNMKTIKELRQSGYKVRVYHERDTISVQTISGIAKFLNARGGRTEIELTTPEGRTEIAESRCSKKENFCRKTGNKIALERVFEKLNNNNK